MNEECELNAFVQSAVERYSTAIAKTAFAYLKNVPDAEDVTQEVFLTLMQKRPEFESEEHRKAWLLRVTINQCKNRLKGRLFQSHQPIPEDLADLPEEQSEVLNAVMSLNIKYRLPIHLYYYEGYSLKEIAEILETGAATIGTRMARARKLLKNMIGGVEDE